MPVKVLFEKNINKKRFNFGFTLIELLVTIVIATVISLGLLKGFGPMIKSSVMSKKETLGSQITQEKIEELKDTSYHRLKVSDSATTNPIPDPFVAGDFSPGRMPRIVEFS